MHKVIIIIIALISVNLYSQDNSKQNSSIASYTWYPFTGSGSIHGVLNSFSHPLQYHPALNTITFFHNASSTYSPYPSSTLTAEGAIVAMVSSNFGVTWDSACVWSDNSLSAINPQGAVYNPPGNINPQNAYIVGCGPVVTGTNYVGNWYSSKKITTASFNYSASPSPTMQFMPNSPPYGALTKHDYSSSSFSSTDDSKVRSIATIANNVNSSSNTSIGLRGALIVTGHFIAGSFNWTGDSLIPLTNLRTDGSKQLYSKPLMTWNQSGTVGYAIFIGSKAGATQSNIGWQPIIYKTTNSGLTWVLTSGIDFNANTIANNFIKDRIDGIPTNPNLKIPYFNINEGIGVTVDMFDKLHIAATLASTKNNHQDSLEFTTKFVNNNELYHWRHTNASRPYLYDFIGDGNTMQCAVIDSLQTEAPGCLLSEPGYIYNPWNADPLTNAKVASGNRIQLSRSVDGTYIVFTWAESDTNFTTNNTKWNEMPNVKARCLNALIGYGLSNWVPVTASSPLNTNVKYKAMFHYASPISSLASVLINTTSITLPITVSNNSTLQQLNPVTHWFANAKLDFNSFYPWPSPILSLKTQEISSIDKNIFVYPNPIKDELKIESVFFSNNVSYNIELIDLLANRLFKYECLELTENKIILNVKNLNKGVYFLKIGISNNNQYILKRIIKY